MEIFEVNYKDLPKYLELKNDHGENKLYQLKPGGRKFGIHLNLVDKETQEIIYKNRQ